MIKGLQKTSLIDYPGNICSVVFVSGCNFRCPYCQNPQLVLDSPDLPEISKEEVFSFLESRKGFIDGVCISGGEPMIYKKLPEFCDRLKEMGLLVKIDTNGSNPIMLKKLMDEKLVDFIAMDIKGSLKRYKELTAADADTEKIMESIKLIMDSGLDYEFRMTVVPGLITEKDIRDVAKMIKGARKFSLQQFNNKETLERRFQNVEPYIIEKLDDFCEIMRPFVDFCEVRGV